jgi:hypothetical protein
MKHSQTDSTKEISSSNDHVEVEKEEEECDDDDKEGEQEPLNVDWEPAPKDLPVPPSKEGTLMSNVIEKFAKGWGKGGQGNC